MLNENIDFKYIIICMFELIFELILISIYVRMYIYISIHKLFNPL